MSLLGVSDDSYSSLGNMGNTGSSDLISTVTVAASTLIGKLITSIGNLIGIAPRGELQKFHRTAYPYMRALAAESKVPVYIGWFGECVFVKPDGAYGVKYPDSYQYEMKLEAEGATPFYSTDCARSDGDCVNHPEGLKFVLHGTIGIGNQISNWIDNLLGDTTTGIPTNQSGIFGGSIWLFLAAGAILYLVYGRK